MNYRCPILFASLISAQSVLASEFTVTITAENGGTPIANAVVYLDQTEQVTPIATEIYQKDRAFHPKVLMVPVGSTVNFPNRDNTQHHVYSFSPAKTFNIELYAGNPETPVLFDQPGVVELGCNIHDHMQAFVIVTETSAIGQTDTDGKVTLAVDSSVSKTAPITLKIWHPRLPDNTRAIRREINNGDSAILAIELTPEPEIEDSMDLLQKRFREL